jgi:peptidoglycan/LPS O-acetylase OafA/YrhL
MLLRVPVASTIPAFARMRAGKVLGLFASFGNATYSSYLLHFPIRLVLAVHAVSSDRSIFFPLVLSGYVIVVIESGIATYHLFEMPVRRRIRE